jgi:Tol biopolymer transport system component
VRLTSGTAGDWEPMVSPDGRYIFFASDRTGERKIWRMNADGSNQVMIGPEEGTGLNPRRSADGRSVLFYVNKGEERFVGSVPIDGGGISLLPPFGNTYWEISPVGDRIAVAEYDERANRGRVVIRPIEAAGEPIVLDFSPMLVFTWSHDGKSFFYRERSGSGDSASTVWNIDLATKRVRPYLSTKPDSVHHLSFSPDGKRVAVVRGKLITDAVLLTTREQK